MKVIYSGPNPLSFHSAPSGTPYPFFPGVALAVKPADEEYFKEKTRPHQGNPWRIEGTAEVITKTAADTLVDAVENVTKFGRKKEKK